jgi:hypothetical protein
MSSQLSGWLCTWCGCWVVRAPIEMAGADARRRRTHTTWLLILIRHTSTRSGFGVRLLDWFRLTRSPRTYYNHLASFWSDRNTRTYYSQLGKSIFLVSSADAFVRQQNLPVPTCYMWDDETTGSTPESAMDAWRDEMHGLGLRRACGELQAALQIQSMVFVCSLFSHLQFLCVPSVVILMFLTAFIG